MHELKLDVHNTSHIVSVPQGAPITRTIADDDEKQHATIPGTQATHPSYVQSVRAPGVPVTLIQHPTTPPDTVGSDEEYAQLPRVYKRAGKHFYPYYMPVNGG